MPSYDDTYDPGPTFHDDFDYIADDGPEEYWERDEPGNFADRAADREYDRFSEHDPF